MSKGRTIRLNVVKSQAPSTPLQDAVTSFYLDRQANGVSGYTLTWYRTYVGAVIEWLAAQTVTDPARVTPNHMRAWLIELKERELAERTIHHHASAARAFFNFCIGEGIIETTPMAHVKMPRLPKEILPAFTPDDVQRLLAACETARDRAIVLCLLDTGCRVREFCALTVRDVDIQAGTVAVHQGKGKKDRITFLGAKARRALNKYLGERPGYTPSDALWLGERLSDPLTVRGLQKLLYRLGQRAEVENCHPHTFRRTMALWSLRNGMNIFALQQIMGHSDLEVLRKYLALVEQDLSEAHSEHGAVDHML